LEIYPPFLPLRVLSCDRARRVRFARMETWWDVPVAEVSAEEKTQKTRGKYEQATAKQRPGFV